MKAKVFDRSFCLIIEGQYFSPSFGAQMKILKEHRCFNGTVRFCEHDSRETKTKMAFSTFFPTTKVRGCLIWLSGLTCTDENFMAKAGAQQYLAEQSLMVICPDTSPRGLDLPGIRDSISFGEGAGFYVDATTAGYRDHFRMDSYVSKELYAFVQNEFHVEDRISILGHSMGGHGALVLGLREPEKFKSISALAPVVNPMKSPWGSEALKGYLGSNQEAWKAYDTCELIRAGKTHPQKILIDQGSSDPSLPERLLTSNLVEASKNSSQKFQIRFQEGYDHSYYFVASFIKDHIAFHAALLA